jgi:hypothetical protein
MPRGRNRSSAALAVVPVLVPGAGRPEPPPDLDPLEQRVWREVIAALPPHWVDPAGQLILRRLAAQAAIAERLEVRLRQLRAADQDSGEEAGVLTAKHDLAAKAVANMLAQLRATPRSRSVPRAAGTRVLQAPEWRPWEIKGGKAEAKTEE